MRQAPAPPVDPRLTWDLPAPGRLPQLARLDEVTVRVLAPNPSPMTLDGTNTYLLGARGSGEALVVDPGPDDDAHLGRVRDAVAAAGAVARGVVVTHHHHDHAAGAARLALELGTTVMAASGSVAGPAGTVVTDGDTIPLKDVAVEVVATPGHTRDHVALRLGTGAVLTGDHVLGRGTSVVAHPDGDLVAYLASLRRVLELGPDVLYPGHGPELTKDPSAVLRYYHDHRQYRRGQILAVLEHGSATPRDLVEGLYAEVDRRVWGAAEASTRAALDALVADGRVRVAGDRFGLA